MATELIINSDDQLREYGILNSENAETYSGGEPVLTRQDFRAVEEEIFDVYPTDDTFSRTVIAAIELRSDANLAAGWGGQPQPKKYVWNRRPSQPDFQLPVSTAAAVYSQSRFRTGVLQEPWSPEAARGKIVVLRETLARKSLQTVMSLEEYERPFRASGGVFVSPTWLREALNANQQALTLADFERQAVRLRVDESFAFDAFRRLGAKLLDENQTDHPDAHAYVFDHYFNRIPPTWPGKIRDAVFSFDVIAAYRKAIDEDIEDSTNDSPPYDDLRKKRVRDITHKAITAKTPGSWYRNGRFVPPPREDDFDW